MRSTDDWLASINLPGTAIGPGMLRDIVRMNLQRAGQAGTDDEVDEALDKLQEDARTREALKRLPDLGDG